LNMPEDEPEIEHLQMFYEITDVVIWQLAKRLNNPLNAGSVTLSFFKALVEK